MENNIFQTTDEMRSRIVSVTVDGSKVLFGRGRLRRLVLLVVCYIVLFFSFIMFSFGFSSSWKFALFFFGVFLLCLYGIWAETRTVAVDLKERKVTIGGQLRIRRSFDWSTYCGYEIVYTVTDIPEEFYLIFQDGMKDSRVKLTNLSPLFRKYKPADYEALLSLWQRIEEEMEIAVNPHKGADPLCE